MSFAAVWRNRHSEPGAEIITLMSWHLSSVGCGKERRN